MEPNRVMEIEPPSPEFVNIIIYREKTPPNIEIQQQSVTTPCYRPKKRTRRRQFIRKIRRRLSSFRSYFT